MLATIGAEVLDVELALERAHEQFDSDGRLAAIAHQDRLGEIVHQLITRAHASDHLAAAA